jgi:hypothetical protein
MGKKKSKASKRLPAKPAAQPAKPAAAVAVPFANTAAKFSKPLVVPKKVLLARPPPGTAPSHPVPVPVPAPVPAPAAAPVAATVAPPAPPTARAPAPAAAVAARPTGPAVPRVVRAAPARIAAAVETSAHKVNPPARTRGGPKIIHAPRASTTSAAAPRRPAPVAAPSAPALAAPALAAPALAAPLAAPPAAPLAATPAAPLAAPLALPPAAAGRSDAAKANAELKRGVEAAEEEKAPKSVIIPIASTIVVTNATLATDERSSTRASNSPIDSVVAPVSGASMGSQISGNGSVAPIVGAAPSRAEPRGFFGRIRSLITPAKSEKKTAEPPKALAAPAAALPAEPLPLPLLAPASPPAPAPAKCGCGKAAKCGCGLAKAGPALLPGEAQVEAKPEAKAGDKLPEAKPKCGCGKGAKCGCGMAKAAAAPAAAPAAQASAGNPESKDAKEGKGKCGCGKAKCGCGATKAGPAAAASGPLDAARIPDLAVSAPILDTDAFRKAVVGIIAARHPNGSLMKEELLSAVVLAIALEVDTISPMLFAPLLVSILKQVNDVKPVRSNRTAKMLAAMELFKAFVLVAYQTAGVPIPEALRYLAASTLDSFLAVIIKKSGELVSADKLQQLMIHQREKLARRALYLQSLQDARNEKIATP